MCAYRFTCSRVLGLCRWIAVVFAVFGLGACGTTGISVTQTIPAKLPTAVTIPRSTPTATSTLAFAPSAADAWKTYQNDRAGYTVEYPADWGINERIESDGADVTTFTPPSSTNDGTGLTVIVRNGTSTAGEIPDMPNTRCQQVTVGKLSGTRCFDTIAFSTTTTFVGQGKGYILAGFGKRLDQNIYQHFLDSFAITP